MLNENELEKLEAACRSVPITTNEYVATDFIVALLETVMDYQNSTTTVERAGKYSKPTVGTRSEPSMTLKT